MRRYAFLSLALLPVLAGCASQRQLAAEPTRMVFFTPDSALLDDPAKAVIADAANLAKEHPLAPIRVLGFADPEGSPAANRALSTTRAEIVAEQLRQNGIAAARISISARGEVPFEMVPIESRRVEIRIGLGR